ncbi:hypothetical protein ACTFIY_011599 [Dictyostelium cf. discoideum]
MACCLLIPSSFFYYKFKKIDQETKRKYKKIKKIQYSILNENSPRFVQPPQPPRIQLQLQQPHLQPPQQFSPPIAQPTLELQLQQQLQQQQQQQQQHQEEEEQEKKQLLKEPLISKLNEYLTQLQQNEKQQLNSSQSSIKTEVHEVSNLDVLKNNETIYEENFLTEKLTPNQIIKTLPNQVMEQPPPLSSIMNQSQEKTYCFYGNKNPIYTTLSNTAEKHNNNNNLSLNFDINSPKKQNNLFSNFDINYQNIDQINNDTPFDLENGFKIKFKANFKGKLLINGNCGIIPNGITHVIFNDEYNYKIPPGSFPNSVKIIEFGKKFNNAGSGIQDGVFPMGLEELSFQHYFISKNNDAPLPTSLKILKIGCHKTIYHDSASRNFTVGSGIKHYQLLTNFSHLTNLQKVTLGFCFEGVLPQSLLNLNNVTIVTSPNYKKPTTIRHVVDNIRCSL